MRSLTLVLENEYAGNTSTGAEAAKLLAAIQSSHLMLNWGAGNAASRGETPYRDGYFLLPKNRIGHCHSKDVVPKANKSGYAWPAMGSDTIDWVGQFRALKADGYKYAVSLETHWRGAGTAEESTRQSWAGMRQAMPKAGTVSL